MALRIGELVGLIRADDSGMRRGITDAELRMRGLQRDMDGRLRDLRGRFTSESRLLGRVLGDGVGRGGDRARLSLGRIAGMARGLGGVAAAVGGIAAKLGSAVPVAAGLAAMLVDIAPAAGVAATGVLAAVSATAALKIGMAGVGDAVKEAFTGDDPKKLAEALEKLSPNARAFVKAMQGLKPQLDALKKSVQDKLFAGLDDQLKRTARTTLPLFRSQLERSAGAMNLMGRGVADAVRDLADSGALGKALTSANKGLVNLSGAPALVVQALGQIGAAAGPAFARLTAGVGDALDKVAGKLNTAFKSGALQDAIETAIGLIGDLADVAGNVGRIIGSVFSAAQVSGGGFVGTLKTITGALADAFASPEIQGGLKALFTTMSTVAQTAAPLLVQALGVIAPVFAALGPPVQTLIKALGDALSPIIDALGPVLATAASAFGTLIEAVAPILPVVGQLVASLLPALTPLLAAVQRMFAQAAPVVMLLVQALAQALAPILAQLPTIVTPIATVFAQLAEQLLPILTQLIIALAPSIASLGQTFATLMVAVAPLIQAVGDLVVRLLQGLMPVIQPLIGLIGTLASILAAGLAAVVTNVVVPVIQGIVSLLSGDFSGAWQHAKDAVNGAKDLIGKAAGKLAELVGKAVGAAVDWLAGLPGRAFSALASLTGYLKSRASDAGGKLVSTIREKMDDAIDWVKGLPGRAVSALGDLGSKLASAGKALIQGFIDGIKSKLSAVGDAVSSVVSKAADFFPHSPAKKGPFSGRGYTSYSGQALIRGFQEGIARQAPALQRQLDGLTSGLHGTLNPAMAPAMAGAGAGAGAGMSRNVTNNYTYNLSHRGITMQQLEALQRRQEAIARVGRPR
ncbi:hypothetical protein ACFSL4_17790 [Streptomyces caeni]|uniref:Phage tail protein n=1 Tax=Streptomyces caeni TaxID=2307231 RepID=A0ABW4ITC5_9ACTN